MGILPVLVDGAVDDEAGRVEAVLAGFDEVAFEVDLHQVGGGDLVVAQTVGVDQKMVIRSRHPQGDVAIDQLAPAQVMEDPVGGGELDPQVALVAEGRAGVDGW